MTFDPYGDMFHRDGEAISHLDLIDGQRLLWARLSDQLLRSLVRSPTGAWDPDLGITVSPTWLYALSGGAGYLVPGAAPRTTTIRAGTMFEQTGTEPTGTDATFLPYTFADNEFTLTHAVGDSTNPRIDLIVCQLTLTYTGAQSKTFRDAATGVYTTQSVFKRRKVNAQVQLIQGTPASVPTYPSAPSGFAVLGAVYIPAAYNAPLAFTQLRDLRIPLGTREVTVSARSFTLPQNNHWTYSTLTGEYVAVDSATATGACAVYLPTHAQRDRLIAVGLYGVFTNDGTQSVRLFRYTHTGVDLVRTELFNLTEPLANMGGTAAGYRHATLTQLSAASTGGNTWAIPNAAGIGDPIWASGHYGGPAQEYLRNRSLPASADRLVLEFDARTGARVWFVKFFLAGGL